MSYKIVSRESDSFGGLTIKVLIDGKEHTLMYDENQWPDALQLNNTIRSLCGELIGE